MQEILLPVEWKGTDVDVLFFRIQCVASASPLALLIVSCSLERDVTPFLLGGILIYLKSPCW
jgi:hypothetical protein